MSKTTVKIILDILMMFLFVLMLDKSITGLHVHEWGGLLFTLCMIVHLLIHHKWIVGATKRFFSHSLPNKAKINYILNVFLCVSFSIIVVTGLLSSKIVFPSLAISAKWPMVFHITFSGIALVILAVHVALHWDFIKISMKKMFRVQGAWHFSKSFKTCIVCIVLVGGGFSVVTSDIPKYLTAPFVEPPAKKQSYELAAKSTQREDMAHMTSLDQSSQPSTNSRLQNTPAKETRAPSKRLRPPVEFSASAYLQLILQYTLCIAFFATLTLLAIPKKKESLT